jgi:hypothetical protein
VSRRLVVNWRRESHGTAPYPLVGKAMQLSTEHTQWCSVPESEASACRLRCVREEREPLRLPAKVAAAVRLFKLCLIIYFILNIYFNM